MIQLAGTQHTKLQFTKQNVYVSFLAFVSRWLKRVVCVLYHADSRIY